jgi:hypothetical protein
VVYSTGREKIILSTTYNDVLPSTRAFFNAPRDDFSEENPHEKLVNYRTFRNVLGKIPQCP